MQEKLLMCVVGLALVIAFGISSAARTDSGTVQQQDVLRLEQRINQLEQRFYSIESNIRNLEQQSRLGGGRGPGQDEQARLYAQLQALQLRLTDYECALAKLDERTLTPAMREARRKSGASAGDRCRVNPETPVRLP